VQVHDEGSIGVRADIDGVIVVIIMRDCDPLGSGELLFQVMSDGVLLLPSEGGGPLARPGLVEGLAYGSHGSDESLLSLHGSGDGLSRGCSVIILPLSDSDGGGDLLLVDGEVEGAARHCQQDSSS
jgi:hypothetical protein